MCQTTRILLERLASGWYNIGFKIPYYSQFMTPEIGESVIAGSGTAREDTQWRKFGADTVDDYVFWCRRSCAIVGLRMILEALGKSVHSTMKLIEQGLQLGGYEVHNEQGDFVDIGWYHIPLIRLARMYGVDGILKDINEISEICESIVLSYPVMASVSIGISGVESETQVRESGGHFIVLHGFQWERSTGCKSLLFHNPFGVSPELRKEVRMSVDEFNTYFSGRILIFWPLPSTSRATYSSFRKLSNPGRRTEARAHSTVRGGVKPSRSTSELGSTIYQRDLAEFECEKAQAFEVGDIESAAWASRDLAETYRRLGQYNSALTEYKLAGDLFRSISHLVGEGWSHWGIGSTLRMLSQYDDALEAYRTALQFFKDVDDQSGAAWAEAGLAEVIRIAGQAVVALRKHHYMTKVFSELEDVRGELWAYTGMAQIALLLGNYPLSFHGFTRALYLSEKMGYVVGWGWAMIGLSDITRIHMNFAYSYQMAEQARRAFKIAGYTLGTIYADLNYADIHRCAGNYKSSLKLGKKALKSLHDLGNARGKAYAYLSIASAQRLLEKTTLAKVNYVRAIDIFRNKGIRHGMIRAELGLAENLRITGELDKALKKYLEIRDLTLQWKLPVEKSYATLGILATQRVAGISTSAADYDILIHDFYELGLGWGLVHGYIQKALAEPNISLRRHLLSSAEKGAKQLGYKRGKILAQSDPSQEFSDYSLDFL